jgi:hypothetical protein
MNSLKNHLLLGFLSVKLLLGLKLLQQTTESGKRGQDSFAMVVIVPDEITVTAVKWNEELKRRISKMNPVFLISRQTY